MRSDARRLPFHSRVLPPDVSGERVAVAPARAGWTWIHFAVRQIAAGDVWRARRRDQETCLVLLAGEVTLRWNGVAHRLGPRPDVFTAYPHAVYVPPGIAFEVTADALTELADCRARSAAGVEIRAPRIIRPEDCGYEIRGGGNASRQIIDIIRPEFPADRLMICEVLTPGGNWSSYPPHKHDVDDPPREADLDEIYYFRFAHPDGYGFQRLYRPTEVRLQADPTSAKRRTGQRVVSGFSPIRQGMVSGFSRTGSGVGSGFSRTHRGYDTTLRVEDGDVVAVRDGYHPFVTAYGYDAYYLNVLAGTRRSMAASDDPRHADLRRTWPAPDARLPMVAPPGSRIVHPESPPPRSALRRGSPKLDAAGTLASSEGGRIRSSR